MKSGRRSYIVSSIAGIFMVVQFGLIFFLSEQGINVLRIIGYALWVLLIVLGWLPIHTFRKHGGVKKGESYMKTSQLVTTGIYAVVRHPQFLAMPLIPVALALISQHWIVIMLGVPAFVLSILSLSGADKDGIDKFGDEYREYMKRVPGFNIILGLWRLIVKKNPRRKPDE